MSGWQAPVEDMQFVLAHVLEAPATWRALAPYATVDAEATGEILGHAARFAEDVLAPLNGPGDLQGCRLADGDVRTPDGFPEAWRRFVEGGWPALACAEEDGGQGLPHALLVALFEMLVAANHAWSMYPGLQHGAYEAVRSAAVPALRERYLPKLVSGEWLATMNLTEPGAGTDLGLIRCRAEPVSSGPGLPANGDPVHVSGVKIFISGGEHDLTPNIVHLVLARLPGAPGGTRGLSLCLVPKVLPDGRRNAIHCDGIERKMGIKASATCQMRYERAEGWLLGEPGQGLAVMFRMMNAARLLVGIQGLGHLEAAAAIATGYARERVQSRPGVVDPRAPTAEAGPVAIVRHPAVRRVLLDLQATALGLRVVAYRTGLLLDEAHHHPDAAVRAARHDLVALLTPVVKAFMTRLGHEGADRAVGVLGGHGYIHDHGLEQHVRDSRIAMIYEGTNEIQAIDLVQRKLLPTPQRLGLLLAGWREEAAALAATGLPAAATWAGTLRTQADTAEQALRHLARAAATDPERPLRVAGDVLDGIGHGLLAWAWARVARTLARPEAAAAAGPGRAARLAVLAEHGRRWLLPQAALHWQRVQDDALPLAEVPSSG